MNAPASDPRKTDKEPMAEAARKRSRRRKLWMDEGESSVLRFVGQIGVLGWIIVTPTLIGLFLGRWLDHRFGTGIFWSAPLLMVGVVVGSYSAWKWIHRQ
jgi:ATP synthase protein I